jgi:tripartite-type tricarboxylate transporter receptor subunit TctC
MKKDLATVLKRSALAVSILTAAATLSMEQLSMASVAAKAKTCLSGVGTKYRDTQTCKGIAFYKGQSVTLIVPTAPGGQYDLEARAMLPYMSRFLDATINVVNVSAGGSVPGQDQSARSTPNGLTIGMFELGSDVTNVIQNLPGLNFNPAHVVMLGGPVNTVALDISSSSSPYKSLKDLQAASQSDPARFTMQTTSWGNINTQLFLHALGVKYTLISGYANSQAIVTGFERGDGNFESESVSQNAPLVQGGQAIALYQDALQPLTSPYYSLLKNVPTYQQVVKRYIVKTNAAKRAASIWEDFTTAPAIAIGGPTKMPTNEVNAMRAAIKYALLNPTLKNTFIAEGIPVGYVNGVAEKAGYVKGLSLVKPIQSMLGY